MNAFIDFEFGEKVFKDSVSTYKALDLISVGVVCNGNSYYAISSEFDVIATFEKKWLRENVLIHIYEEYKNLTEKGFGVQAIYDIILKIGKPKKIIANEIYNFLNPHYKNYSSKNICDLLIDSDVCENKLELINEISITEYIPNKITFNGWHCESDWKLICELYSNMGSLPIGYDYDMRDVKQYMFDSFSKEELTDFITVIPTCEGIHHPLIDAQWILSVYNLINKRKDAFNRLSNKS